MSSRITLVFCLLIVAVSFLLSLLDVASMAWLMVSLSLLLMFYVRRSILALRREIREVDSKVSNHHEFTTRTTDRLMREILKTRTHSTLASYRSMDAPLASDDIQLHWPADSKKPRILFITSNGGGVGHVTRCLAIAEAGTSLFDSAILTLSAAYELLGPSDIPVYYHPSKQKDLPWAAWNRQFAAIVDKVLRVNSVSCVVFDGPSLFDAVKNPALSRGIPLVWICRGLWKRSISTMQAAIDAQLCHAVLVPDEGGLAPKTTIMPSGVQARMVPTIRRIDEETALSRDEARAVLGLSHEQKAVLIQVGHAVLDGKPADLELARAVSSWGREWVIFFSKHPLLSDRHLTTRTIDYPALRYGRAFEFAVGRAGYNFVHEAIGLRLPIGMIPDSGSLTDDQDLRAKIVNEAGIGVHLESLSSLPADLERLRSPAIRSAISSRSPEANGSRVSSAVIHTICELSTENIVAQEEAL